jgi:hypothetical protein
LGDLGEASLNYSTILHFLDVLFKAVSTHHASTENLSNPFKLLLELTVRLLACAQRMYFVQNEWNAVEDLTQQVIVHIECQPKPDDYHSLNGFGFSFPSGTVSTISESPFVQLLLCHIFFESPEFCSDPRNRLVEALSLSVKNVTWNENTLISMLCILCASAEIFPLGNCWASSTLKNWRVLSMPCGFKDFPKSSSILSNACSAYDVVAIVQSVGNILDKFGGHSASSEVQKWTLLSLTRLTVSSDEIAIDASELERVALANAWRRVWTILHSSNHCYNAKTADTSMHSIGDLVLRLLTQMVRFCCMDIPTGSVSSFEFLQKRQIDIWNLKVFEQLQIDSPVSLYVLYVIVTRVGVSDLGDDTIGLSISATSWHEMLLQLGSSRRSKLICLCLHVLNSSSPLRNDEALLPPLFACLAALVNGFSGKTSLVFSLTGMRTSPFLPHDKLLSNISMGSYLRKHFSASHFDDDDEFFVRLWHQPLQPANSGAGFASFETMENVLAVIGMVHFRVFSREIQRKTTHSIGSPEMLRAFGLVLADINHAQFKSAISSESVVVEETCPPLATIVFRMKIVKGCLTVLLSSKSNYQPSFWEETLQDLTWIFSKISMALLADEIGNAQLEKVLFDLVQTVRGFVYANVVLEFFLPDTFIHAVSSLYDACEEYLESYVALALYDGVEAAAQSADIVSDTLSVFDDDSADRPLTLSSKRKGNRQDDLSSRKRILTSAKISHRATRQCAFLIGLIFLELSPTYRDIEFVAKKLLGVDVIEDENTSEFDVDVCGGVFIVEFLVLLDCLSPGLWFSEFVESESRSISSLICKIIRTIRSASSSSSTTHIFGYSECANVVAICDGNVFNTSLNREEAKDLVGLFICESRNEKRSLVQRPLLRSQLIEAVTDAFRNADENFHSEIDNLFGVTFVLPFLSDLSSLVRIHASLAIAYALIKLSEDKVVESVRRRLSPVTGVKSNEYRRWYANKNVIVDQNESVPFPESQLWEDAYVSLQYDSISCWCVVAGTTSSRDILQQVLFDLALAAVAHPNLEALCFGALARISRQRGFSTVEELLDSEMRNFFVRWISSGLSFRAIPLMICIPSTFQLFLQTGLGRPLISGSQSLLGHLTICDLQKVQEVAISDFLLRNAKYVFPLLTVSSVKSVVRSAITMDGRRLLLEHELVKEYCSIMHGRCSDDLVKKTLSSFIPVIFAEVSFEDPIVADDLARMLNGLLTESSVQQKCREGASISCRRVLEIVGEIAHENATCDAQTLFCVLFDMIGMKGDKSCLDMIREAGCSIPEMLAMVRFHLNSSCTESQMITRWKSAVFMFRFMTEQVHRSTLGLELWCALDFLLIFVLEPKLYPIRINAIREFKTFMQCFPRVGEIAREHRIYLLKRIFIAIMGLHRKYQKELITECSRLHQSLEKKRRRNEKVLRQKESSRGSCGPWNWAVANCLTFNDTPFYEIWSSYSCFVSSSLIDCVLESYNLIDLVIRTSLSVGLNREFLGYFCAESQEVVKFADLSRANPAFCAQQLVLDSLLLDSLPLSNYVFDELDLQVILSYQSLADHAILTSELNDFAHYLRFSGAREGRLKVNAANERALVCSLSRFCSTTVSEETRIAASRCLGEIPWHLDPSVVTNSHLCPEADRLSSAISNGRLLSYLQSLVLTSLTASITHQDPRIAMVAMDSLKCLLSCRVTRSSVETIVDPATTCLLRQIVSNANPVEWSNIPLESNEINSLLRHDLMVCEENSDEWCWDDLFWLPKEGSGSSSFETWICRLVPSLLVCCYDMPSKFNTNGKTSCFYALCQRISYLDPAAAQALFPCIILDLLLREGFDCERGDIDGVLADTWIGRFDSIINVRLSRCFGLVLQQSSDKHYYKAIELVVDVIDMLRRLTQFRFSISSNHKINKRSYREVKSSDASSVNIDKSTMPWRGAPYGVVLQLDGILVANACINIGRFEEAVFYAELFADTRFDDCRLSVGIRSMNRDQSSHQFSTRFISGFSGYEHDACTTENDMFSFFEILRLCYASLGDNDAREAIDQLHSDFSFGSASRKTTALSSILRLPPSLQKLQRLDAMALREKDSYVVRLSTLNCLDGVGLRDTLRTYISGLTSGMYGGIALDSSDCDFMQEKIYECRIHDMQWDTIRHQKSPIADFESFPFVDDLSLKNSDHISSKRGFYKCLVDTIDMIRRDDAETGQKCLLSARIRFADRLIAHGSDTLMFRNFVSSIDDLRTLNDLEDFVRNPDSAIPFQRMMTSVDSIGFNPGNISATSDCIREILTRYYLSKGPIISSDLWKKVADSHYKRFHVNLQFNRHFEAEACLQRLEFVTGAMGDSFLCLHLPLLEAKLLESKGDYNAAIRNSKLLVKSLRKSCQPRAREILADSLLLCGEWMTRYKVAPAGCILSDYLQPAMNEALLIFASTDDETNASRATRALLANGHLVANLFDAVSTRLQSMEWKRAEASLHDREAECDRLENKAKQRNLQSKKKTEVAVSTGDDLNNQIYRHHLKREIRATRTHRNAIVRSLEAHRILAINSIGKALAIAGFSEPDDISKFVYRLVGIWFSSEKSWSESVNDATNKALQGIPSFRFVPVIAQLLSHLANERPKQTFSFQQVLQDLIVKVSLDHPYHCLLHLITLSASKNSLDLDEKAVAASFILHRLSSGDPSFLAELVESYKKLSSAYIHLATSNVSDLKRNGTSNISLEKVFQTSSSRLDKCLGSGSRKAKYLPCIFTKPPMIRPGRDYGEGINDPIGSERVNTFEGSFTIADTGVNQPKIVVCVGTNNGRYRQLVKGADDTRQDAVMEQVFGYANDILARHQHSTGADAPFATDHALRLITYNVVPLNHVAGVSRNAVLLFSYSTFLHWWFRFSNGSRTQLRLETL